MKQTRSQTLVHLLVAIGFAILVSPTLSIAVMSADSDRLEWRTSVVKLLASPEEFNGQIISVIGYLRYGSTLRLYLSRDHAKVRDFESSIAVIDKTEGATLIHSSCRDKYVRASGRFRRLDNGVEYGLADVVRVQNADDSQVCCSKED
jgi:hypothetical protein